MCFRNDIPHSLRGGVLFFLKSSYSQYPWHKMYCSVPLCMVNKSWFPDGPHGGSILPPLCFSTPHHTTPQTPVICQLVLAWPPHRICQLFLYFLYSDVKYDEIHTESNIIVYVPHKSRGFRLCQINHCSILYIGISGD